MRFRLIYTRRAAKDIARLDPRARKRIGMALARYRDNPFDHLEKISDPELGSYRLRVGDYRVIVDIEGEDMVVLRVGHRREIYRR